MVTYLYDAVDELTKVQVDDTAHGSYFYDDAGRRTKLLYGNSAYASYLYRCLCQLFSVGFSSL